MSTTEEAKTEDELKPPKDEASKPEESKEETVDPETVEKVAERLKFFLSDANIRQDFFVRRRLMTWDCEYPGKLLVETLLKFNTIKQFTESPDVIVRAAKTLPQLEVSEDGKAIGPKEKFTDAKMDDNIPLTLHVRNLPLEKEGDKTNYACTSDDIRKLFEQYGSVALVKLRWRQRREWGGESTAGSTEKQQNNDHSGPRIAQGDAMVEFERVEDMQKAAADVLTHEGGNKVEQPKRKLMLGENELKVQTLEDFLAFIRKRKEPHTPREEGDRAAEDDDSREPPVKFEFDWKPGCVIKLTGLSTEGSRETLLDAVAEGLETTLEKVKERNIYVDYSRGREDGAVRFNEPSEDVAKLQAKLAAGDLLVTGTKVTSARILEGDEEEEYWKRFIEFKTKQLQQKADERASRSRRHHKKRRSS